MKVMRAPEYTSGEVVATFATTLEIVGKSIKTMFNGPSLLKLSPEIQAEIRSGTLPVSQGYLFAANLDCPDLRDSEKGKPTSEDLKKQKSRSCEMLFKIHDLCVLCN